MDFRPVSHITPIAGAEALKMSLFQLWGLKVLPRENFQKNIGANICNLVHFVDEVRNYGVQDRGVHGMENHTGM